MRGSLIALEGIDGAGTTTQARLLEKWLQDRSLPCHLTCEPSNGPVGRLLREILVRRIPDVDPATVALLFAADRMHHLLAEVEPLLARGTHVVTDRYVYSSLAYQGVLLQDQGWVARINSRAQEATLTIYLRLAPELAARRRAMRGTSEELFDDIPLQEQISLKYDTFFGSGEGDGSWVANPSGSRWIRSDPPASRRMLDMLGRSPCWVVLDADLPADVIHERITSLVEQCGICAG